ncbi:MAG: hypothetical protein AAF432_03125, partial [Planctomycetota bacterium]
MSRSSAETTTTDDATDVSDVMLVGDQRVKRILPWVLSIAIHAVLIVMGFFVTWTVAWLTSDDDSTLVIADFDAITYTPVQAMPLDPLETESLPSQDAVNIESLDDLVDAMQDQLDVDPVPLISSASSGSAPAPFTLDPTPAGATFVGLTASNARRVVYVIDASGSMIRSFPIVLDELTRSLRGLSEEQSFGVVFFQKNDAIVVPPTARLRTGGAGQADTVREWIDANVIPVGRSNPMAA